MIQLNLLPEVKAQFIKARRAYRLILIVSIIVSLVSLTGLIIYYISVDVVQRHTLNNNIALIQSETSKIKSSKDIDQVITIQKLLESLPALYSSIPRASNLIPYIVDTASPGITINTITMNYQTGLLSMTVQTDNLTDGNIYYNQLNYATYTIVDPAVKDTSKNSTSPAPVFTNLKTTGLDDTSFATGSSGSCSTGYICFTVTATMPTALFARNIIANNLGVQKGYKTAVINVPNQNVTHSTCDQPSIDCFVSKGKQ
jgi:hypothetical protein